MVSTTVRIWIQQNSSSVSLTSAGWPHDCCSCFEETFTHTNGWNRIWHLYWLLKFLDLLKKYHLTSGALDSGEMSLTPGFTQALQCLGREVWLLMHTHVQLIETGIFFNASILGHFNLLRQVWGIHFEYICTILTIMRNNSCSHPHVKLWWWNLLENQQGLF